MLGATRRVKQLSQRLQLRAFCSVLCLPSPLAYWHKTACVYVEPSSVASSLTPRPETSCPLGAIDTMSSGLGFITHIQESGGRGRTQNLSVVGLLFSITKHR